MITVQDAHSANETHEFILQQGSLARPSAQKMAVLMRTGGHIDMLLFSDRQGDSRYIPNVGGHIGDGLNALMGSEALLEASSILVIHHNDGAVLTSRHGNRIMDLIAYSNHVGSLQGRALEQAVRDDIAFLRRSQYILKSTEIKGLLYDGRNRTLFLVSSAVN